MNIEALKRRLARIDTSSQRKLKVVRLISPPEPDLSAYSESDLVIIRDVVSKP